MWKLQKSAVTGEVIAVCKINENGNFISASLSFPEYLKWLEEGNKPLPADEAQPSA